MNPIWPPLVKLLMKQGMAPVEWTQARGWPLQPTFRTLTIHHIIFPKYITAGVLLYT